MGRRARGRGGGGSLMSAVLKEGTVALGNCDNADEITLEPQKELLLLYTGTVIKHDNSVSFSQISFDMFQISCHPWTTDHCYPDHTRPLPFRGQQATAIPTTTDQRRLLETQQIITTLLTHTTTFHVDIRPLPL